MPATGIGHQLFCDGGRLPRTNLAAWTASVRAQLDRGGDGPGEGALSGAGNVAALLCVHYGRPDVASALCHAQLDWTTELVRRSPSGVRLAIAPWINLGRLASRRGDVDEALGHFRLGEDTELVSLGPLTVSHGDWLRALDEPPEMRAAVDRAQLLERMKALLRGGRYHAAIEAAEGSVAADTADARDETRLIALVGLRRHREALEAMSAPRGGSDSFAETARLVQTWPSTVELRGVAAGRRSALAVGSRLQMAPAGTEDGPGQWTTLALAIARILERAQEPTAAADAYERALSWARVTHDEPDLAMALDGTVRTAAQPERLAELRELLAGCEYASVRNAHGLAPPRWTGTAIERLTTSLLGAFGASVR